MIKDIIEFKRQQLYETIGIVGLSAEETISVSRELERFMNYHAKISGKYSRTKTNQAKIHVSVLQNILDVISKEKLHLPFEMDHQLLERTKWMPFDFAHTLLHAMIEQYGSEIEEYIGECVPIHGVFPKEIQSFHESLKVLDYIFHLNHRSPDYIGEYLPFMDIKDETVLFCYTPHYSSTFNLGIIKGLSKKFNHSLKVKVLDHSNGGHFKIVG
ncbi:aspartyl-phosphate phosphatase Spo0E family protein [Bacillus sp. FJAT-49736]|uniref:aspartyl-phosphate phosphatase Spo0E family protein n=1 Tax=Bacillus sp. FJAT-49736 TaxID=2833582 RepID=UPI001BC9AFAB|nr:aspartyl-phosphate phosphatase Spo0E family protein [Bacillus sp. FJAT-49736]MBS4174591.1 aspartyl-phosphate phosphatase Spo0E family protein [Bacillus sp. FJAT-49736]